MVFFFFFFFFFFCCGTENSTKLRQVEHPPVKSHHQSQGPCQTCFSLAKKILPLCTHTHKAALDLPWAERKKQKQLLALVGLSQAL